MFARKRSFVGFSVFILFDSLFLLLISKPGPSRFFRLPLERAGYAAETYFSALTLAFFIILGTTIFLATIFCALVAGDIVAKEAEDGNLRLVLSRPVSRGMVLLSKFIACQIYTLFLVLFIGVTAYATGTQLASWNGGLFAMSPEQNIFSVFDFETGLKRYGYGLLLITFSLGTVSSVGFLFSCQPMRPATAAVLSISLLFTDLILSRIPYFAEFKHWFLASRMKAWVEVFRDPIPWTAIAQDYAALAGVSLGCFILGWLTFARRDLKA